MDAEMNPSLLCRILNEDVGWPVARVARLRQLSRKGAPVFVGQATLEGDSTLPSSVVVKVIPLAPVYGVLSDGRPAEAEALWHSALSKAGAPLPHLFWHGLVADKGRLLMITEDMDEGRRNKDPEAQWSLGQMEAVMEAIGAFHVAGRSLDHSEIRAANPWLRHMSLEAIDGAWIRRLVALDRDLGTPIPEEAVSVVLELADRYDAWKLRLCPLTTIIHADFGPFNVALHERPGGGYRARILDLECCRIGLPQYDVEYCLMRWNTQVPSKILTEYHRRQLAKVGYPSSDDTVIWQWGTKVAHVQLTLAWLWMCVEIVALGEKATPRDKAWLKRQPKPLCGPGVVETCRVALKARRDVGL